MQSQIRMGVLGCAQITKAALLDAAPGSGLVVTAVASRSLARAEAYAREHGIAIAHGAYEALILDPDIDAIYNPLPNSLHAEWTIRALQAGKAVLCEKPIASNAGEAREMAQAAQTTGQPLMEAFHYRYHPMMQHILDVVSSGALGAVQHISSALEIPGTMLQADNIRFQLALAGGALMDVGAYCMNAIRAVAGEEPQIARATPTAVRSQVDGAMTVAMTFPSGAEAELSCSLVAPALRAELLIAGARGSLLANNPFLPQMGHALEVSINGEKSVRRFDATPTYVFQARAFAALVQNGTPPLSSMANAIANMEALDACYRAAGLPMRGLNATVRD